MLIRRIARPMLAAAFIATGVEVIRRPESLAETAQPYIDKAKGALPPTAADFIPSDPQVVVRVNGAIHIVGGLALATGKFPRLAALSLASVVVPTTLAGHDFWNETDPHERAEQQAHFIQNVGLLGGLLLATVDTEGKPSLAWRGRKAAAAAGEKVASALPTGSSGSATTEVLTDKASHLAGLVSERTGELAEVAFVVGTHNLAIGVLVGVLLSGVFFAWKIAQIFEVRTELSADGTTRVYHVTGQLFFASADQFMAAFDFAEPVQRVVIDLTHAHIWDISSVASIDKAVLKFRQQGVDVVLSGLNKASATIVDDLGMHQRADADIVLGR